MSALQSDEAATSRLDRAIESLERYANYLEKKLHERRMAKVIRTITK